MREQQSLRFIANAPVCKGCEVELAGRGELTLEHKPVYRLVLRNLQVSRNTVIEEDVAWKRFGNIQKRHTVIAAGSRSCASAWQFSSSR